jgi:hypothetical protein
MSSGLKQATFYKNLLTAWRSAGTRIPFLNIIMLHDLPTATCDMYAAYYGVAGLPGVNVQNFKSYLCSLGVRNRNSSAKAAWVEVLAFAPAMTVAPAR